MRKLVVLAATVLLFASLVPEDASAQRGRGIGMGGARVGAIGGMGGARVGAIGRPMGGIGRVGIGAPGRWAGVGWRGGPGLVGRPVARAALGGYPGWGVRRAAWGADIQAGGSDARPGGAHRSHSGSDLGPLPMGPVTDGTHIMGTTLTYATPRPTPATTATTNHRWPRLRGSKAARAPAERPTRAPSGPSFWVEPACGLVRRSGGLELESLEETSRG